MCFRGNMLLPKGKSKMEEENENKVLSGWKEDYEKGIAGTNRRVTAEKAGTGGEGNLSGRSSDSE